MSSYKNNVHLEGNLGKDAEKKSTPNGDVVNFSIAVNEQWEDKDGAEHKNTDWFQIQVWGPLAKFAATLKAGTPVIVEGKIKPEMYTADGVEHKTFSIKADYIRKIDYSAPSEGSDRVLIHADTEPGAKDLLNDRMALEQGKERWPSAWFPSIKRIFLVSSAPPSCARLRPAWGAR